MRYRCIACGTKWTAERGVQDPCQICGSMYCEEVKDEQGSDRGQIAPVGRTRGDRAAEQLARPVLHLRWGK